MKKFILSLLFILSITVSKSQILNFADSITGFSSQYGAVSWSANQVLGFPNVYPAHSDNSSSWASSSADESREFIEVYFKNSSAIDGIWIYETFSPGAVDTVYIKNPATDLWEIVWQDSAYARPAEARIFKITFEIISDFEVSEVRIALNSPVVPGWNEIDAVALVDNSQGINDMNLCNGDSVLFREEYYSESAQLFDTLNAELSIVELFDIVVHPDYDLMYQIEILQGDSALINGIYQKEAVVFSDALTSIFGCDSLVETRLVVKPVVVNDNPPGFKGNTKITAQERGEDDLFGSSVAISGDYAIVGALGHDLDASESNPLFTSGAAYIYKKDASGNWTQIQKIVASDRESNDLFGSSVSIDGDYAIVSSPGQNMNETGNDNLSSAGAVYIFERMVSDTWVEVKKLVAADRAEGDKFGTSVSISGNYIIVGANFEDEDEAGVNFESNAGSAYIFELDQNSGTWNQLKKIVATDRTTDSWFGRAVAISGDHVLVGAYRKNSQTGGAYVFQKDAGGVNNWGEVAILEASDARDGDWFGVSVAIDGNQALVGAYNQDTDRNGNNLSDGAGAVYAYEKDDGGMDQWGEVSKLVATDRAMGDHFGNSVSISENYAIIGAIDQDYDSDGENFLDVAGAAYVFRKDDLGSWYQLQKLAASDRAAEDGFGRATAVLGEELIVTAFYEDEDANGENFLDSSGSIYAFRLGKGDQEFSFDPLAVQVYGSQLSLDGTASSVLPVTFQSSDESVATISNGTVAIHSAGTTIITASQPGNAEFNAAMDVQQTLTVIKAGLMVIVDDKSRSYGDTDPEFTFSYAGFVNGEDESVLDLSPNISTNADLTSPVGTYAIVAEDGVDNNYEFIYQNGILTINKAMLNVGVNDEERTYGEENPTFSLNYSGFVNEENESIIDSSPVISTEADISSGADTYALISSGGIDNNYDFNYLEGTLTINKAMLIATADDQTINEDESIPGLTISYDGFVNNEDVSVLDVLPTPTTVEESSVPGTYEIILTGGLDDNYEFNLVPGLLTINKVLGVVEQVSLKVWPNPVLHTINVLMTTSGIRQYAIYDLSGRVVLTGTISETQSVIDFSRFAKGNYSMHVFNQSGEVMSKRTLIKK